VIDKAPDAYRTISEVGDELDLPQHVLRFWETRFTQIRPLKRGGGRRYYRPDDVELLKGIRHLLYSEGYTIKGVQRILKEQGPKAVQVYAQQGEAVAASAATQPAPPPPVAPSIIEPPVEPWTEIEPVVAAPPPPMPEYRAPVSELPPLPEPVHLTPPVMMAQPTAPAAPATPPAVSYMRGGLLKPQIAPQADTIEAVPAGISLRRPKLPLPMAEPVPARFAPLPEEDGADETAITQDEPMVHGLSEDSRRALQSALFELSECRRSIERVMAARDR